MNATLGFDVYGTLIDTAGISTALKKIAGTQTENIGQLRAGIGDTALSTSRLSAA